MRSGPPCQEQISVLTHKKGLTLKSTCGELPQKCCFPISPFLVLEATVEHTQPPLTWGQEERGVSVCKGIQILAQRLSNLLQAKEYASQLD